MNEGKVAQLDSEWTQKSKFPGLTPTDGLVGFLDPTSFR